MPTSVFEMEGGEEGHNLNYNWMTRESLWP